MDEQSSLVDEQWLSWMNSWRRRRQLALSPSSVSNERLFSGEHPRSILLMQKVTEAGKRILSVITHPASRADICQAVSNQTQAMHNRLVTALCTAAGCHAMEAFGAS